MNAAKHTQISFSGVKPPLKTTKRWDPCPPPVQTDATRKLKVSDVEALLRDKIQQNSRSSQTQIFDAFKMFGRPSQGISKEAFRKKVQGWGIPLTSAQVDACFGKVCNRSLSRVLSISILPFIFASRASGMRTTTA
jgi:hypothetical protein